MLRAGFRRGSRAMMMLLFGALCLGAGATAASDRSDRAVDLLPPRVVAQSSQFELVGVAHGKTLTIYLDRFIDNEPVVGAALNVEAAGQSVAAAGGRSGIYKLNADWVEQVGRYAIAFTIASNQGNDRLAGTLDVPEAASPAAPQTAAGSPFERMLSFGNLFVFLLGALATLALRHANRLSGIAMRGANNLVATLGGWRGDIAARVRRTARLPVIARLNASLSAVRAFAAAVPVGRGWAARPVGATVAAIIGFVVIAAVALLLFGRTVLAHEGDAPPASADPGPAAPALAIDAIAPDAGPRRLLDGSLFVSKASQRLLNVRTVIAHTSEVGHTVQMVGRVVPDPGMSGEIHASVRGRLEPIGGAWPKVGQQVKAGEVLAWVVPVVNPIDRGIILQQVAQIEREIGLVRDRVNRLGVARDDANLRELDDARAELSNLVRRREAIAAVMRDRDTLRAPLIAPSTGLISASFAVAGQVVDEQQKLFEVIDLKRLWVEAYAYDLAAMGKVLDANARSPTGVNYHLKFVSRGPQLQRQTIPLYFQITDPDPSVSVGTLLSVLLETSGERSGIVLPRAAVVRNTSGQDVVWQHTYPESFVPVPVRTESVDAKSVLVSAGLTVDTRVVIEGADLLNEVR
jgi:cobalt-zinc-cadmium efflux system membrane fusion protein